MSILKRVLFVSDNDTSVGPMAVAILTKMLKEYNYIVESRGMVVVFPEPYNEKAQAAAEERNMNLPQKFSRQISEEDFRDDTIVLTMTKEQRDSLYTENPDAKNIFTLSEFAGEPEREISNPSGGNEEYLACFDRLYSLIFKAADILLGVAG